MEWSRFNLMFESKRNGWLLFNCGSNSFVQMDEKTAKVVKRARDNPDMDFSDSPDLYFKLRLGGFLVENGGDDDLVDTLKLKRLTFNYRGAGLSLAIAPTRECNFACEYCYEKNRTPSKMSDETEKKIIEFIKSRNAVNRVHIEWYGGEPLLEPERMRSLSEKVRGLGKEYTSSLITNGYLLTPDVIGSLNELGITFVQITIDGLKESHDKRRFLVGGGATYDKIIENMDNLMNSSWKGSLQIRINIDKQNKGEYSKYFELFRNRYPKSPDKAVFIFTAFVYDDDNPENDMFCNSYEKGKFFAGIARDYGINNFPIIPRRPLVGSCIMTQRNSYMVGPDGEVYKCLAELGREEDAIGMVGEPDKWNTSSIAERMIGASYLEDERCVKCSYFPVCDGGCHRVRLQNKRDNKKRDTCLPFKGNVEELLEIYYEHKNAQP